MSTDSYTTPRDLTWCMLTREQDYAYARPSMIRAKVRKLELATGAPSRKGVRGIDASPYDDAREPWVERPAIRDHRIGDIVSVQVHNVDALGQHR